MKIDEGKIRILELVSFLAEKESDRTWSRFSILLSINAGIIALTGFLLDKYDYLGLITGGIFGLILSIVWYKIIPISKYYENRWHQDMIVIIRSDPSLEKFITGRFKNNGNLKRPLKRSASDYVKLIPLSLGLFWIITIIISIIKINKWF